MILTIKEQAVIKAWNKKGIGGLRLSSLVLLENIGGKYRGTSDEVDERGMRKVGLLDDDRVPARVAEALMRFTLKQMPQGLWGKAEGFCREICFLANVDFDEGMFARLMIEEEGERIDEEFGD